jgi:hypothetical protein
MECNRRNERTAHHLVRHRAADWLAAVAYARAARVNLDRPAAGLRSNPGPCARFDDHRRIAAGLWRIMLKRLLFTLALLCGIAAAQNGGAFPPTSLIFPSLNMASSSSNATQLVTPAAFWGSGTWIMNMSNVSGSPSGCTLSFTYTGTISSNTGTSGITIPLTVSNGTKSGRSEMTAAVTGPYNAVSFSYGCTNLPTTGTAQIEFIPDYNVRQLYSHIASNTSVTIGTGPVFLHTLVINTPGSTETITLYDNSACSGTTIAIVTTPAVVGQTLIYDVQTTTGLCITTAGTTAGDYTVTYR